jgi:hypothetical protein
MPEAIATFNAVKFLWEESKPVRKWLWSKLPFAQDSIKRDLAEAQLAGLLEDSNKLARQLLPEAADEAIDKRIGVFRDELLRAKIPKDQVDTLAERAGLFVKLLVTGPLAETAMLEIRMGTLEQAFEHDERALESVRAELRDREPFHRMELAIQRMQSQLWVAWSIAGASVLIAAIALIVALRH